MGAPGTSPPGDRLGRRRGRGGGCGVRGDQQHRRRRLAHPLPRPPADGVEAPRRERHELGVDLARLRGRGRRVPCRDPRAAHATPAPAAGDDRRLGDRLRAAPGHPVERVRRHRALARARGDNPDRAPTRGAPAPARVAGLRWPGGHRRPRHDLPGDDLRGLLRRCARRDRARGARAHDPRHAPPPQRHEVRRLAGRRDDQRHRVRAVRPGALGVRRGRGTDDAGRRLPRCRDRPPARRRASSARSWSPSGSRRRCTCSCGGRTTGEAGRGQSTILPGFSWWLGSIAVEQRPDHADARRPRCPARATARARARPRGGARACRPRR